MQPTAPATSIKKMIPIIRSLRSILDSNPTTAPASGSNDASSIPSATLDSADLYHLTRYSPARAPASSYQQSSCSPPDATAQIATPSRAATFQREELLLICPPASWSRPGSWD